DALEIRHAAPGRPIWSSAGGFLLISKVFGRPGPAYYPSGSIQARVDSGRVISGSGRFTTNGSAHAQQVSDTPGVRTQVAGVAAEGDPALRHDGHLRGHPQGQGQVLLHQQNRDALGGERLYDVSDEVDDRRRQAV